MMQHDTSTPWICSTQADFIFGGLVMLNALFIGPSLPRNGKCLSDRWHPELQNRRQCCVVVAIALAFGQAELIAAVRLDCA